MSATTFIVVNKGAYGTIRMRQEREFAGHVVGTDLVNPDFAAYARAFVCVPRHARRRDVNDR